MAANGGGDLRNSILRTILLNLIGAGALRLVSLGLAAARMRLVRPRRSGRSRRDETPYTDPVTGDKLTRGEWVSWGVQRVMRRWAFLGAITLVTVICWATRNDGVLLWWNLCASYAALVIEGITAMALINQTLRDARVSRETRSLVREELRDVRELLQAKQQAAQAGRHAVRGADGRFVKRVEAEAE